MRSRLNRGDELAATQRRSISTALQRQQILRARNVVTRPYGYTAITYELHCTRSFMPGRAVRHRASNAVEALSAFPPFAAGGSRKRRTTAGDDLSGAPDTSIDASKDQPFPQHADQDHREQHRKHAARDAEPQYPGERGGRCVGTEIVSAVDSCIAECTGLTKR